MWNVRTSQLEWKWPGSAGLEWKWDEHLSGSGPIFDFALHIQTVGSKEISVCE